MPDDRPVSPQLVRQHIEVCERRWDKQERRTRDLEEAVTEHRMRLQNGTHAFESLREAQKEDRTTVAAELAKLQPKPVSPLKVAGLVLGLVGLGAGALWGLSEMLNDRPTDEQIHQIMDTHEDNGHKELRDDVKDIAKQQAIQKEQLDDIDTQQQADTKKLDVLLDRVPPPKKKRNR